MAGKQVERGRRNIAGRDVVVDVNDHGAGIDGKDNAFHAGNEPVLRAEVGEKGNGPVHGCPAAYFDALDQKIVHPF